MIVWRVAIEYMSDIRKTGDLTTWGNAHAAMVRLFEHWTKDQCRDCAANAAEQLPNLRALPTGQTWTGEVEGDDYFLEEVDIKCPECGNPDAVASLWGDFDGYQIGATPFPFICMACGACWVAHDRA